MMTQRGNHTLTTLTRAALVGLTLICLLLPAAAGAATEIRVSQTNYHHIEPVWRAQGDAILHSLWQGSRWRLYYVEPAGSYDRQINYGTYSKRFPVYSDDGQSIAYSRWDTASDTMQLFWLSAFGGTQTRLTYGTNRATAPAWSPDGRWVAYQKVSLAGRNQLFKVRSTAGTEVKLAPLAVKVFGGNGSAISHLSNVAAEDEPTDVASGDFNEDGDLDIAFTNKASGSVSVMQGDGTGAFTAMTTLTAGEMPAGIAAGYINNDSHLDLAVGDFTSEHEVHLFFGTGAGGFTPGGEPWMGTYPDSPALADLDGDGDQDLVSTCYYWYRASVVLNNGDGTFGTYQLHILAEYPSALALGDLNGDDRPDIVASCSDSDSVNVLINNGDGTFPLYSVAYATGIGPADLALADVNGDTFLDAVTADSDGATFSVLLGTGTGTFGAATSYPVGTAPSAVTVLEANGDTAPDIAVACEETGQLYVFHGTGGGAFSLGQQIEGGDGPSALATTDVDDDEIDDLILLDGNAALAHYYDPQFSPDGTQICYWREAPDMSGYAIYVMDAGGGPETPVTPFDGLRSRPRWSPDGTKLAYEIVDADDFEQIAVLDLSTTIETVLTSGEHPHMRPRFSPDGTEIAYHRRDDTGYHQIYKVATSGGPETALTTDGYQHRNPAWSADGAWVAYQKMDDTGYWQIYKLDPSE